VVGGVRVCEMRLLSWNVQGLGGLEKRKEVKELVREKMPFLLCIQESKFQLIDDFLCTSIWGPSIMIFYVHRFFMYIDLGRQEVWLLFGILQR